MKNFALTVCLFGMALSSVSWSEPSPVTSRLYAQQCNNLKNTATALEMWATDNQGKYPDSLQQLTPNYLKYVMPGPGGKTEEVVYQKDPSRPAYSLSVKSPVFRELKVNDGFPRYVSDRGLEFNADGNKPELNLPLLKLSLDGNWEHQFNGMAHLWLQKGAFVRSSIFTEPFGNNENLKRQFEYIYSGESLDPVSKSKWRLVRGEHVRRSGQPVAVKTLELRCLEDGYMKTLSYETEDEMIDQDVYVAFKNLMSQP